MLIVTLPTTLLQFFCKIILNSKVIVKSVRRQFPDELHALTNYNVFVEKPVAVFEVSP